MTLNMIMDPNDVNYQLSKSTKSISRHYQRKSILGADKNF